VAAFPVLIYFFMKEERKNFLKLLNMVIPGVALAHAIGRIGCFTAGCCYGKPTDSPLGVIFPRGYYADIVYGQVPVHPTQLYEAAFLILLFFSLTYLPKVKEHKFAAYLIGYGTFRAFLETFFRGDDRGLLFGIAPSLILSFAMTLAGIAILIFKNEHIKTGDKKL
jgi:phosphatidylglycerol:prolipoprotein diacylglycerol transferase